MLIGYVSDERYIALHDVQLELANENLHVETRSRATGEVFADLPPGPYTATLQKDGFGPKRVQVNITPTDHTTSAYSLISCSATPGPNGSKRATNPSFASTRSKPIVSTCGATAGKKSTSARWAGSTSTDRVRLCRLPRTATTCRPG